MRKNPTISVVVPAYNEEKYIGECLLALKNQTYPKDRYEVIVVDNNSTDNTAAIAKEFGVRIVGCQVQGVAAARVAGSEACDKDIIAQTDADSAPRADWLEKIANHFTKDHNLIGCTGAAYLRGVNPIFSKASFSIFNTFQRFNFLISKPTFSGFNFAVRRQSYKEVGGIDPNIVSAEDVDLSFRLKKAGKIEFFSDCVVYTSARRITNNPYKFFKHHVRNYFAMISGKSPEPFENIR